MDFVFAIFGAFFSSNKVGELILPAYVVQEVTKEARKSGYELMVFPSRIVSVAHTFALMKLKNAAEIYH